MQDHNLFFPGGEDAALLIHGLTGSPYEMKYMAQCLNKAGYTVAVPCLAGHGTTVDDLKKTTWKDWYATIKSTFAELKNNHKSVSVGGLCMGAVLGLYLAYECKTDVGALSLMSTTLAYDGWALPWYRFLTPLAYYTPLRYYYAYPEGEPYGIKNERLRRIVVNSIKNKSIAYDCVPGVSMYELYKLAKATKAVLPKVTTPALVIHSTEDDTASLGNARYVIKNIGSKVILKLFIKDCYHMITIDNKKELVANETISFFDKNGKNPSLQPV